MKRKIVVIVIILLLTMFYIYNYTDFLMIKKVNVIGNLNVTDEEIKAYVLKEEMDYFNVDLLSIEDKLKKYSIIKKAVVKKSFPNTLNIEITERIPIVAVSYSDQYLLVDEELYVVKVSEEPDGYYIIDGYKFKNFNIGTPIDDDTSYLLKHSIDLAFLVMSVESDFKPKIVIKESSIHLIITDTISANFGDGKNIEKRFNDMINIYNKMISENLTAGIINVFHDGQPSLKLFEEK